MGIAGVLAVTISAALALGACGRMGFKSGSNFSKRVIALGQPVPKGGGVYKVGKPYQINGRWFYPREDAGYDKVGIASWYGELFHGRYTANREIYDMNALTAAHPTLPLPVYAQVTNLTNGRSLVVRVNDRGPYANDRVIDMSKRSADLLGFKKNGTARVRVRYLARAPLSGDDSYERHVLAGKRWARAAGVAGPRAWSAAPARTQVNEEKTKIAAARVQAKPGASSKDDGAARQSVVVAASGQDAVGAAAQRVAADPIVTASIPAPTVGPALEPRQIGPAAYARKQRIYVQSGAFKIKRNAERLRERLAVLGEVRIFPITVAGTVFHRVRLGPFEERKLANATLAKVVELGANGASVIGE